MLPTLVALFPIKESLVNIYVVVLLNDGVQTSLIVL